MIILAIDTSCDDTSISILKKEKGKIEILSNIISSQVKLHQKYGGVYPMLAKREHQKNLVPVLKKALKKADLLKKGKSNKKGLSKILKRESFLLKELNEFLDHYGKPNIDAIALTVGPGLEPCLWVGVNFAKALRKAWGLKIIPVNHIEGHLLVNLMDRKIKFPSIGLIVSGGHTQLILIKGIGDYKIIGETRDDAAGECFDKTARILGLSYPGGPIISKLAQEKTNTKVTLPRPMINTKDFDFSFSGLKTAVLYHTKKNKMTKNYKIAMAKEIQQSIVDVLIKKTMKAKNNYKAKTIILGGGVTANNELKKQMKKASDVEVIVSDKKLCTDNAAMIGIAGLFSLEYRKNIRVKANLRI